MAVVGGRAGGVLYSRTSIMNSLLIIPSPMGPYCVITLCVIKITAWLL